MKKIISILCLMMAICMFAGCVKIPGNPNSEVNPVDTNIQSANYYEAFDTYIKNSDKFKDENFIASPTSLRAALCLAIAGADEGTLDELLKAAGFESKEDAEKWYKSVVEMTEQFKKELEEENKEAESHDWYDGKKADRAFEIVNSIWNNEDRSSDFKQAYKDYVHDAYGAEARSEKAAVLADEINKWCDEKTHGMIPHIIDDAEDISAVLANALYLRTTWLNEFWYGGTHEDVFTCKDGSETKKMFMSQADEQYRYYENDKSRIVILPMAGNISFVCVLGDASDINEKIAHANDWEYAHIHLVLPKLDIESTFKEDMIAFLNSRGAKLPFGDAANFSSMSESEDWYIKSIIQKARIKSDEKGLEAAAVTAIMMDAMGALIEEPEIIDFIANKPFSFFIYSDIYEESREMLFCGQLVK